MRTRLARIARGLALLALVAGLAVPAVGHADDDKDEKNKRSDESSESQRSARDDRQTSGQVLEINTLKNPPEMWIANTDGVVHVRMLTTDLIEKNAVRLGDHVTVIGEKVSEVQFDCQEMSVDGHYEESDDEDDEDD
jgi:hypothetical protein